MTETASVCEDKQKLRHSDKDTNNKPTYREKTNKEIEKKKKMMMMMSWARRRDRM